MRFKVDENLPWELFSAFVSDGHDVMSAGQQRLGSRPDAEIAHAVQAEGRCLVTLDLDFANVRAYRPDQYSGIIVLRPQIQSVSRIGVLLTTVLQHLRSTDPTGRLWVVDESGIRIRSFVPPH